MKTYTLNDVQEAANNLKNFIESKMDNPYTHQLLLELSALDYTLNSLDEATALNTRIREIEMLHHKTIMGILLAMPREKRERWFGMYVIHDLICYMAHFGFVTRYAIRDEKADELIDEME